MPITSPGVFAGSVSVDSTLQLWGAEANAVGVLFPRQGGFEFSGLAGLRYVQLRETLAIDTLSSDIPMSSAIVPVRRIHQFNTCNQFFAP